MQDQRPTGHGNQSNDQAFVNARTASGHVRAASTAQHGPSTNATGLPSTSAPQPANSSIIHPSPAQPAHNVDFSSYGYNPGGALMNMDWGAHIDFAGFQTYFEPVGELRQEPGKLPAQGQDFNIPQPVAHQDGGFEIQGAESKTYTSTITPPPVDPEPVAIAPPPPRLIKQTSQKRKAESEPNTAAPATESQEPSAKRAQKGKAVAALNNAQPDKRPVPVQHQASSSIAKPTAAPEGNAEAALNTEKGDKTAKQTMSEGGASINGNQGATGPAGRVRTIPDVNVSIGAVLPAGKVFPIQIGSELFRLSGASISSDAPSYFSHFFGEQLYSSAGRAGNVRTLYIDRDPYTFRDISLHLQGYHIIPRDGEHFVKLFADAQFYSLPRLTKQLFKSEIFVQIGQRHFRIPRDIFSNPGDSPNYFSLGFAHFFTTPNDIFPGLDRQALLRPPSILPPAVPNRCGDVFADLLRICQGYPVHVRDEGHRSDLLRDARYFHLKGVEQKLIPCDISFNLARNMPEICIRLEDIRQSGVSFTSSAPLSNTSNTSNVDPGTGSKPSTPSSALSVGQYGLPPPPRGYISYARPFTDESPHTLILEIGGPTESTKVDVANLRAAFYGQTKARVASLFQVIANKLNLPAQQPLGLMMSQTGGGIAAQPASPANSGLSGERVKTVIDRSTWLELDGNEIQWSPKEGEEDPSRLPPSKDLKLNMSNGEWVVQKGQWRIRVQPSDDEHGRTEVVLCAVKVQAYTSENARNGKRKFLG